MFSDYSVYGQQAEMQLSVKLCLEFIQDNVSGFTFKIPVCKREQLTEEKYQLVSKKVG